MRVGRRLGGRLVESTGSDGRFRFLALENGDFVVEQLNEFFELLEAKVLAINDGQESFDERSPFGVGNRRPVEPHVVKATKITSDPLRPIHGVIENLPSDDPQLRRSRRVAFGPEGAVPSAQGGVGAADGALG